MSDLKSRPGRRISRRALLKEAGILGLVGAGSGGLDPVSALANSGIGQVRTVRRPLVSAAHLVIDYRPSQPTGWGGVTIGGHVASVLFIYRGSPYQIDLLAFGQSGHAPDPVYEPEPSDQRIAFKRTLQRAWGAHYSFRYRGGFAGRSKLRVQSYNVTATEPTATLPQLRYGGDLFMLYEPERDSGDPAINDHLHWIQVVHTQGRSYVDGHGRDPYYSRAGLTSIHGKQVCDFYDRPGPGRGAGGTGIGTGTGSITIESREMFETFLVQDGGVRDRAGKKVIDIFGGVKWGFQIQPVADNIEVLGGVKWGYQVQPVKS